MVEEDDALSHPQRTVIRNADHPGAELDVTRALSRRRYHDFRRGGELGAGGVMLAEPCLIIAAAIQPLDEIEIALQCKRWVDAGLMEGRKKNAEAQALAHGTFLRLYDRAFAGLLIRSKLALDPPF